LIRENVPRLSVCGGDDELRRIAVPSVYGGTGVALDIVKIIAGLLVLVVAADRLVVSAVRVAKVFNISAVVIGAIVVGFGTSVPEFVVSIVASLNDQTGLAMSNVVASNVANLTLVLGSAALFAVLVTTHSVVKREGLLMLASVAALAAVLGDGLVSVSEGAMLLAGMAVAVGFLLVWARKGVGDIEEHASDDTPETLHVARHIVMGIVALVATIVAGRVLLSGVLSIGESAGLSVVFMGLITGVGTSLPELSAAFAGARRGESDLVLGNVLGSNIFNSLGVAGVAAIIGPGVITTARQELLWIMIIGAVFAGLFAYTSQRISRIEGSILIAVFAVYSLLSI